MKKRKMSQAKFIAYAGVLSALAIVLVKMEIPYILVPWLKFDLSEVIILIASLINIWLAIIIATIKAWLPFLFDANSIFIAQFALWMGSIAIVIPFYFLNKKYSTLVSLTIATIVFTVVMTALNYFFITPVYLGTTFSQLSTTSQQLTLGTQKMIDNGNPLIDVNVSYLQYIIAMYVPFNLVKGTMVSAAFAFVSKRIKIG